MASDSIFGNAVLGTDYLPPSPAYPIQQLLDPNAPPAAVPAAPNSATQPAASAATATAADATAPPAQPAGLNVPLAPPAGMRPPTPPGQGAAWGNMPPIVGNALAGALAPQANAAGLFGPNTGRFMSALGAGLSSAGQNWNKPAAAAFATGAGAAIQGGQQYQDQQQNAKLQALQVAIAAWKVGDIATYHQALANYHAAVVQQRRLALAAIRPGVPPAPAATPVVPNNAPAAAGSPPPTGPAMPQSTTGSPFGPTVYGAAPVGGATPPTMGATSPSRTVAPGAATGGSTDVLAQARDAIARGAPRDVVIKRLRDNGIDPSGL